MELSTILLLVVTLACPIGMGLMMWLMSKNMGGQSSADHHPPATSQERLAVLRTQQQALEVEIAEVTRLVELEAQREALLNGKTGSPSQVGGSVAQRVDSSVVVGR
jgi:hypothetical protein